MLGQVEDTKKKAVTLYLPPALCRNLKVQAAERDRTMSDLVADALKQFFLPSDESIGLQDQKPEVFKNNTAPAAQNS